VSTPLNILLHGKKTYYVSNLLLLFTFESFEDNGTEVASPLKSGVPVWIWIPNQGRKSRSNYSWDFRAAPGYASFSIHSIHTNEEDRTGDRRGSFRAEGNFASFWGNKTKSEAL